MPSYFATCLVFYFWLGVTRWSAHGQSPIDIQPGALPTTGLDIRNQVAFSDDNNFNFYPTQIRIPTTFRPFPNQVDLNVFLKKIFRSCWVRFTVRGTPDSAAVILYTGPQMILQLYRSEQGRLQLLEQSGSMTPQNKLSRQTQSNRAVTLRVPHGQNQTFYLRIMSRKSHNSLPLTLFEPVAYRAFLYDQKTYEQPLFLFLTGMLSYLLLLACFWLLQYYINHDSAYGWYGLYLLLTFAYLLRTEEIAFSTGFILPNQPLLILFSAPFLIIGMEYTYLRFVGALLAINAAQKLNKLLLRFCIIYLLLLTVGWIAVLLFSDYNKILTIYYGRTHLMLNLLHAFILTLILWVVFKSQHSLRVYVLIGGAFLTLGFVINLTINSFYAQWSISGRYTNPAFYSGVGILLEVFCLSVALGKRTQLLEDEKKQTESLLETREAQFRQRIAETEMTALRAQMNPHFIFNCLNSIQFFTAQNDADKATDYLTKFSRLIRLVLENSKSEKVTLANELETLQLYIDMEAMRFQQKLHYQIQVDEEIGADSIQIPPLLLQPFVENAIWHGLMHKEEGGLVRVVVKQTSEDLLHIEIADDGVGRQQAADYKSKSSTKKKSFGMKLTADRVELINQLYNTHTQVNVVDLTDEHGHAKGTKVIIEIPI